MDGGKRTEEVERIADGFFFSMGKRNRKPNQIRRPAAVIAIARDPYLGQLGIARKL